jgi:AMP nucleosidase
VSDIKLDKDALEQIDQFSRDRVGLSTLERYTGSSAEEFQPFILLTGFKLYVDLFAKNLKAPVRTGSVMDACHAKDDRITIINCSVGSPTAALVVELLSFIKPKAVLMIGMCGGLRDEHRIGDFFNPVAAIRGEGTSDFYMPKRSPSLSSFVIQRFVCEELERRDLKYYTGVIHTTNVRFWEFNDGFKKTLIEERAQAIDMECATLFTVGFAHYVPIGALLLISDMPLKRAGVKTASSAKFVFEKYTGIHLDIGIKVLKNIQAKEPYGLGYKF